MNAPPDWQDGECCFRCRTQFTLVARKHHCRNCGNIFCAKCSSQQIPLPKLNIEKNVRVCDTCYEKIAGKEDPLALALGSKDKEPKAESISNKQTNSKSSTSNQSGANASAPSEQELKEEEDLQLALALSLSENPTKVSFPDYRHLEENQNTTPNKTVVSSAIADPKPSATLDTGSVKSVASNSTVSTTQASIPTVSEVRSNAAQSSLDMRAVYSPIAGSSTSVAGAAGAVNQQQQQQVPQTIVPHPMEYHIPERDHELFRYIGEVHGTLEVFNNRLEACKLRRRPVSNDAAIQSLFIKLNSEIQPKLTEYIKVYEDEREVSERIQDKLSQIADARAALDALREEHQERMRQMAAEAEKQRQSQLASKLEAMRQKKTQMMQYQRELAMQRIREQEMMYQQPQQQHAPQDAQSVSLSGQPTQQHWQQQQQQQQQQIQTSHDAQYQQPYVASVPPQTSTIYGQNHQQQTQIPHQHQYDSYTATQKPVPTYDQQQQLTQTGIDRTALAQLEKQFLPDAKPDEEAPLISFDD